jgi:hypothetical protein
MYHLHNNQQLRTMDSAYRFIITLPVLSSYFLNEHSPVDPCNGEVLCFLCGTE